MPTKLTAPAFILFLILFSACAGKQAPPAAGQVIDLSGIWDHPEEILLSSIATDIEYIPLETTPECLLGDPDNLTVTITDRHIAINSGGLKLFDREGHFLRAIGSRGRGPLEYVSSSEYVIDEQKQQVHILDVETKRVLTYGLDGSYSGVFRVGPEPVKIFIDPQGRIGVFYLSENPDPAYSARVEWYTGQGALGKTIPVYSGRPRGAGWVIAANCYQTENQLLFNENPFDTTYQLQKDHSWEPRWIIRVGPGRFPPEVSMDISRFSQELDQYILAKPGAETSRYLFITTHSGSGSGLVVFDKKSLTARYMPQELFGNRGWNLITNDLDGGLPLKLSLQTGEDQGDSWYANLLSPLELITRMKEQPDPGAPGIRPSLRKHLLGLVGRLHEDGNPVVMIVKLKAKEE